MFRHRWSFSRLLKNGHLLRLDIRVASLKYIIFSHKIQNLPHSSVHRSLVT